MNDFAAKKAEAPMSHFDIVRRIETMSGEIPYAIKQFKSQVLAFRSMDKKLSAMKSKTEKRASSKKLDRLEEFITEYQGAYRKCRQSYTSIVKALDEIEALYSRLSDYYHSEGKRREAKRAISDAEKFDKPLRKQLEQIYEKLEAAVEIVLAKEGKPMPDAVDESKEKNDGRYREEMGEEDARRRREDAPHRYNQNNSGAYPPPPNRPPYPPYASGMPYYPPYDYYRMPPAYYQPMPSFNIAPISIDVNSAVDSLLDSFTKTFDERAREYALGFEFPEAKRPAVSEGEYDALGKVIEDEGFALEKLSELFEKLNAMLTSLSELTAKFSELEEKNRALADSMKTATDTQRTLARELQGIQATQKVIGADQLKLAEEQTIVVEAQSVAISRQAELREAEGAIANDITALIDGANVNLEAFKASVAAQNDVATALGEIANAQDKLLELQRNLEERQSELTEIQRDALLAQKKLTRSQKAVNERLGAKTSLKKEKPEKLTPPEAVGLEITEIPEADEPEITEAEAIAEAPESAEAPKASEEAEAVSIAE